MAVANSGLGAAARAKTENGTVQKVAGYSIDKDVLHSIRHASKQTGVDFGYLMAQAAQESSFQPEAKASTSSATGLYQFLDSTWMSMVKAHGAKHGLGDYASQIQTDSRGNYSVADPAMKRRILDLRKDPQVSAVIGAEFALSNKQDLERNLGREVGSTELYLAHFLGSGGATRFLRAIERNANQSAASLMPEAAAANRGVFYNRDTGEPRTVNDVYKMFARSIESKSDAFAVLDGGTPGTPRVMTADFKPQAAANQDIGITFLHGGGTAGSGAAGTMPPPGHLSLLSILAMAAMDDLNPSDILSEEKERNRESQIEPAVQQRVIPKNPYKNSSI